MLSLTNTEATNSASAREEERLAWSFKEKSLRLLLLTQGRSTVMSLETFKKVRQGLSVHTLNFPEDSSKVAAVIFGGMEVGYNSDIQRLTHVNAKLFLLSRRVRNERPELWL